MNIYDVLCFFTVDFLLTTSIVFFPLTLFTVYMYAKEKKEIREKGFLSKESFFLEDFIWLMN